MESETLQVKPAAPDLSGLKELLERASQGDESAVPTIRVVLDLLPQAVGFFGGDLARDAERALLNSIAGVNLARREALQRRMDELRAELGGDNPRPLERLLVARVVLCWLHVHHADCQSNLASGASAAHEEYLGRQQERAQRQYLAAIKCLATVRRLALSVQVDLHLAPETRDVGERGPAQRSLTTVDVTP